MKITEITQVSFSDGSKKWRVSLENETKPVWLAVKDYPKPPFKVGDDIPQESLEVSKSGKSYILTKEKAKPVATSGRERYTPDGEDWTNIRTAVMQAVELHTHHVPPAGKVNTGEVMQVAAEIFAAMVMMKPKRGDAKE